MLVHYSKCRLYHTAEFLELHRMNARSALRGQMSEPVEINLGTALRFVSPSSSLDVSGKQYHVRNMLASIARHLI